MLSNNATIRDLKIKTGVVKRIGKEFNAYNKEAEKQQTRINLLIEKGADEADVRKQKEVLDETVTIIPDTKQRLVQAHQELSKLLDAFQNTEQEEVEQAKAILEETKILIQ